MAAAALVCLQWQGYVHALMSRTLEDEQPLDDAVTERTHAARPYVRAWLLFIAVLILAMVTVGGATRLTGSGLSITEWQPIMGTIPPLSEAAWQEAFDKYREIPQYQLVNRGMSLDEFKFIYWWEWGHRFLGRFIGLAFFAPLVFFWATGRLEGRLKPRLVGLFVLGGLQGALGWYMVMSGLVDRVEVSQYRLAAHLGLAFVLFGLVWWTAITLGNERRRPLSPAVYRAWVLTALIFAQILAGAFVAGLNAGLLFNTWPLMEGRLIPAGLFSMSPWWINPFENMLTVQFIHRLIAYGIVLFALFHWVKTRSEGGRGAAMVLALVLLQAASGVWTLLAQVPLWLGLLHQAGAVFLLAGVLWHLRALRMPRPAT